MTYLKSNLLKKTLTRKLQPANNIFPQFTDQRRHEKKKNHPTIFLITKEEEIKKNTTTRWRSQSSEHEIGKKWNLKLDFFVFK